MVNLLFISNSPKMAMIKSKIQPVLKIRVDIVTDFDYGLKDVFEKRPTMVFIQDQISGVTGESVARHVQVLLGSGAPTFIFMHQDSSRFKPIKGLFEHLVDLSQGDSELIADILAVLKSLLGPQWSRIHIATEVEEAVAETLDIPVPEISSEIPLALDEPAATADPPEVSKPKRKKPAKSAPVTETSPEESEAFISKMAEMLVDVAKFPVTADVVAIPTEKTDADKPSTPAKPKVRRKKNSPPQPAPPVEPAEQPDKPLPAPVMAPLPEPAVVVVPKPAPKPVPPEIKAPAPVVQPAAAEQKAAPLPVPPSPAVFSADSDDDEPVAEGIPQDLLLAFEDNYRSQARIRRIKIALAVVVVVCLGCAWYLFTQKPAMPAFLSRKPQPTRIPVAPVKPVPQKPAFQRPVSTVRVVQAAPDPLPSFIPQARPDKSFATQNPGWERYLGAKAEYRVFRSDARIKALQVLALSGEEISSSLLKSILKEFTGSSEYRVVSQEKKSGLDVSRARGNNSELLIYRNNTIVRAFVVSRD